MESLNFDYNELYKWIDEHPITRQKRNINRDFSDAVPLAEILKLHYPKLVDLHNYSPQNAYNQKLMNWQTINRRVLNKLRINLTQESMVLLAKAQPGAIENLLYAIKKKIESKTYSEKNTPRKAIILEDIHNASGGDVVPVKVRNGSKFVDQKMLPLETYNKIEQELKEKTETIEVLQNKVQHLEQLLEVKEERIRDLTRQLQTYVNESTSISSVTAQRSSFFNSIF